MTQSTNCLLRANRDERLVPWGEFVATRPGALDEERTTPLKTALAYWRGFARWTIEQWPLFLFRLRCSLLIL